MILGERSNRELVYLNYKVSFMNLIGRIPQAMLSHLTTLTICIIRQYL